MIRPGPVILGVQVDDVTWAEAVAAVERYIAEGMPRHVVTVNPEYLVQARQAPAFREVLNRADLRLPDGVGITLAARALGTPLRTRIPGADLVERLAERAAARGYRMFLLGAAPGVAAAAGRILEARYPALPLAGVYAGDPGPMEEAEIVARVRQAAPDILLVAYGAPQQDLWIRRNLERLGVPVCIGVGGTFDYISGRAPRAPGWMRSAGLEWLFRLLRQPWRWRRMLRLPRFVALVLLERGQGSS